MVHLNDIDLEMTTLCRCAPSVPICQKNGRGLAQLRNNAAECIR